MIFSPIGRSPVASLPSPVRRHTNPGEPSASALMRSRLSTKSLSCGESSGAFSSATLIWASWYPDMLVAPLNELDRNSPAHGSRRDVRPGNQEDHYEWRAHSDPVPSRQSI